MKRPEISASYKETSAPRNSSKMSKSTSDVWNHFIKETDQNGMVWAKCQHCGKCLSWSSKVGTTSLKNHLNSSKCKRSQKETGGLENPTVTNGNFVLDEERSSLDLVRMIIKDGYPLNMVEHECFKSLMKNLQPAFKLPSQDTLKDKILCFYREEKEKLCKQFDMLLSFSLILNFWTDCGKKNKYCSFTMQFIEDGPKLKKKIIAIKNVEYNYAGKTLFEMVKGVLLEWNIDKKLATITVESSYANDEMVNILQRWLHDQGNCHPLIKKIFHIPCITHEINLIVKYGLDEIDYILHKIRKAIKYMSETTIGKQKLEEVVKKLNLGGKDITFEGVPVRWDSTFFMLQIALELRRQEEAFVDLQSSDCVFPLNLSVEEWDEVKVTHKWLAVFYDVTFRFFGSKCLSTNVYICMIHDILNSLNQLGKSDLRTNMRDYFVAFFMEVGFVYNIVAVFDPRTKLDLLKYEIEQCSNGDPTVLMDFEKNLGTMFNLYAEHLTNQRSSSSAINNDNSCSSNGDHPCNMLDDWKKWYRQRTELEKYLREPLQPDEKLDILGWWHTKSQDSPTLWTMARDILAIPMSTSTSNSAFCIETMTLDPIFNDLDLDIIEALFCGKHWLDNPIRITSNKDNDHSIANPEPMLENPGSTSGPEPLQTGDTLHVWSGTLEPQEKHDLSNADMELMPANCSATSCPEQNPLPTKECSKSVLAYAQKQSRSAVFECDEKKKGCCWLAGDFLPGWEKKVKVTNIPAPTKKTPAKHKSASKSRFAAPQPAMDAPISNRTRGSKRKTSPRPMPATKRRSKHKEDTSSAHPIDLDEPEFEDQPEPLSVYRPTAEELTASMGTHVVGSFDRAGEAFQMPITSAAAHGVPAETRSPPTGLVPSEEGTHTEGVSEATPFSTKVPIFPQGPAPVVISTSDPFVTLSQAAKDGSSLVVTPSIPSSATRGPDVDLSSDEPEDILEDLDNEPVLPRRISESEEEEDAPLEVGFRETFGGLGIAASVGVPAAVTPAAPTAPILAVFSASASAIFTASVSAIPSVPASVLPTALINVSSGPLLTAPFQFEAGSSSSTLPGPVGEAAVFFTRFDQPEVNDLDPAAFWGFGPPYVDFHGFRVPEDCVSHLAMIYDNRGDFMQGFRFGRSVREHFLKMLGSVLNDIEHNFVDTVSTERILQWRAAVQELVSVGFAVEFLLDFLREIARAVFTRRVRSTVDVIDSRLEILRKEVVDLEGHRERLLSSVGGSDRFGDQPLIFGLR